MAAGRDQCKDAVYTAVKLAIQSAVQWRRQSSLSLYLCVCVHVYVYILSLVVLGERVLSAEWVRQSTTPAAPHVMPGPDNKASDYPYFGTAICLSFPLCRRLLCVADPRLIRASPNLVEEVEQQHWLAAFAAQEDQNHCCRFRLIPLGFGQYLS